jgi:hypothetical protein
MKKYNVTAYYTTTCFVEIEAENEDDAYELARDMDGGSFTSTDTGDWRIVDIEEVEA